LRSFFQVVRKRGASRLQLACDVAHHQPLRMGGQQQTHDAQTRLGAHGREHVGKAGDGSSVVSGLGLCHVLSQILYFYDKRNNGRLQARPSDHQAQKGAPKRPFWFDASAPLTSWPVQPSRRPCTS
jgi:hypothetical protein